MALERKASLNTHYTNTHDRFFRSCFAHVVYARALLQLWFSEQMQSSLDLSALENKESSLPSIAKESDLLFSAGSKDKREICILLEHKHQRHPSNTYRQMADYRIAIKHSALSRNERPVIVSCIFYHGRQAWKKQQQQGLYRVTYDAGVEGIESEPIKFHVLDLERLGASFWPKKDALYSILHALLKVQHFGDMAGIERREFFRQIFSHLDDDDSAHLMQHVITYVSSVCGIDHEEVMGMLKSSGAARKEYLETWEQNMGNPWKEAGHKKGLEAGLKQGRTEGLEKGLEKGRTEVAVNMLQEGFSVPIIAKATGLSTDEIEGLKKG